MLTVRDVMSVSVVTVLPDTTVRQLARLLADEEISGAPVLDQSGTLLGVVSATDVVRLAAEDAEVHLASASLPSDRAVFPDPGGDEEPDPDPYGFFLPEDSPFSGERLLDQFAESELDATLVSEIMTPVAFSIGPEATLKELAEFLMRGRIHRAVVVEGARLRGIVSSVDVLRAVADGRLT
ncbi:MAG TPA: CBS domain-containing protein [Longimicrobiales bacterium]|nr:CBS domain-containing protein [Longimicrobiales bacterium]